MIQPKTQTNWMDTKQVPYIFCLQETHLKPSDTYRLKVGSEKRYSMQSEGESEAAQSCLTLCDPMDYSLPGSSVHGILQARILEWVAISFSRGSSQPRDRTQGSNPGIEPGSPALYADVFTIWATREVTIPCKLRPKENTSSHASIR